MDKHTFKQHQAMMAAMRTSGRIMDNPTENIHSNRSTVTHRIGDDQYAVRNKDFIKRMEIEKQYGDKSRELAEWTRKHETHQLEKQRHRDTRDEAKKEMDRLTEFHAKTGYINGKPIPSRLISDPNSRGKILERKGRFDFFSHSKAEPDVGTQNMDRGIPFEGTDKTRHMMQLNQGHIKSTEEHLNRDATARDLISMHTNKNGKIPMKDHVTGDIIELRPQDVTLKREPDGRGLYLEGRTYGMSDDRNGKHLNGGTHNIYKKVGTSVHGNTLSNHTKIIHGEKYQPLHSMNRDRDDREIPLEDKIPYKEPKYHWSHGKKVYEE